MSMQDFIGTLTDEQRAEFARILASNDGQDPINSTVQESVESGNTDGVTVNADFTVDRPDRNTRVKVKGGTVNEWTDDGEHKDVETPEFKKVARTRPAPVIAEYTCHVCSKKFKSSPDLMYGEHHRCDRCGGG